MKKALALILVAVMLVGLLAACGNKTTEQPTTNTDNSAQTTTPTTPTTPTQTGTSVSTATGSKAKDTIVFAQSSDVTSLDFHQGKNPASFDVTCNMFDTLVAWDENNHVIPWLAESWNFIDEDSVEFTLRKGVKFHDGVELKAEDVKYTYDRALASTIVKNNFSWLESVEVSGDYTVVLNTTGAYTPVLNALCSPLTGIMPKHLLEGDEEAMAKSPVGTGPYKFVERKEGEYVKMEANAEYWNGAPKTQNLEMRVVPEASQRATLLETGEIDVAYDVLASDVNRIEENENTKMLADASFKVFYLTVNVNSGTTPLTDARVRKAIEYAIDKTTLCSAVMYGYATPVNGLVGPGVFGYDDSITADIYDPETAKNLLKEAGYADGFDMTIWVQSSDQTRQEACVILQDMLSEVGINVTVEPMDGGVMDDTIVKGGDFDSCSSMYYNLMGDADYVLYSNISPESTSNLSHYNNQEVMDKLIGARSITDDAERAAVYAEINQIMAEERPYIPLWAYQNLVGLGAGVDGFRLSPITAYRYENVVAYTE